MKIPVNVDEYGAVYVVPKTGGVLAGGTMVEVGEDFDFTKLHLYRLINGELVFDQQAADDEKAREEQAEREHQEYQLKGLNEVLSEALLKMLYIEDAAELPALFAEIREKYSAELAERDSIRDALDGVVQWVAPTVGPSGWQGYGMDVKVRHKGHVYISKHENNTCEPGTPGTELVWVLDD